MSRRAMRIGWVAALLAFMLACAIPAGTARAAEAPAGKNSRSASEAKAVRAAAVAAERAKVGDNFEALAASIITPDDRLQQWKMEMRQRVARRAFYAAVAKRFGNAGKAYAAERGRRQRFVSGDDLLMPARIKRGKVVVKGDSATIEIPRAAGLATLLILRNVDGRWKQEVNVDFAFGQKPEAWLRKQEQQIAAIERLTRDVRDGQRFATLQAADEALAAIDAPRKSSPGKELASEALIEPGPGSGFGRGGRGEGAQDQPTGWTFAEGPADEKAGRNADEEDPFASLLQSVAYERGVIGTADGLKALRLSAKQSERLATAKRTYESELEAYYARREDELTALRAAVAQNADAFAAVGPNAGPERMTAELRPHEPVIREGVEVDRRFRLALSALLTPDQRQRWEAERLREALKNLMEGEAPTPAQTARVEAACRKAALEVMALPEPRDPARVREISDALWKRTAAELFADNE